MLGAILPPAPPSFHPYLVRKKGKDPAFKCDTFRTRRLDFWQGVPFSNSALVLLLGEGFKIIAAKHSEAQRSGRKITPNPTNQRHIFFWSSICELFFFPKTEIVLRSRRRVVPSSPKLDTPDALLRGFFLQGECMRHATRYLTIF